MSRGHGRVQRACLMALYELGKEHEAARAEYAGTICHASTADLARKAFGLDAYSRDLTNAQKAATSRALHGLQREGLVSGGSEADDYFREPTWTLTEEGRTFFFTPGVGLRRG